MTIPEFLADMVMVAHAAFSLFVVLGLAAIITGRILGWQWTDRRWFRVLHLAATLSLVARVWLGFPCPFSVVENYLRQRTDGACVLGQAFHDAVHQLAFRGEEPGRFAVVTTLWGLLALAAFLMNAGRRGESLKAEG
jgi:hypothetical protein